MKKHHDIKKAYNKARSRRGDKVPSWDALGKDLQNFIQDVAIEVQIQVVRNMARDFGSMLRSNIHTSAENVRKVKDTPEKKIVTTFAHRSTKGYYYIVSVDKSGKERFVSHHRTPKRVEKVLEDLMTDNPNKAYRVVFDDPRKKGNK